MFRAFINWFQQFFESPVQQSIVDEDIPPVAVDVLSAPSKKNSSTAESVYRKAFEKANPKGELVVELLPFLFRCNCGNKLVYSGFHLGWQPNVKICTKCGSMYALSQGQHGQTNFHELKKVELDPRYF